MKLKNMMNKLVTVCGVSILPGGIKTISDVFGDGNSTLDFFVKTNRLTIVSEKAAGQKAESETGNGQKKASGEDSQEKK